MGLIKIAVEENARAHQQAREAAANAFEAPPEADMPSELDSAPVDGDAAAQDAAGQSVAPAAAPITATLMASMAPIFRAAMMYPGVDAEPNSWALAVGRMSEVSAKLAQQLALMRKDEMDVEWARREIHPAVARLIGEWWVQALIRNGGARSVAEIPLQVDDLMPGLIAAQRAIHANLAPAAMPLSVEAVILEAVTLTAVHAQRYADGLARYMRGTISVDAYLQGVFDCLLAAVEEGVARAERQGIEPRGFRLSLAQASVGVVVTAVDAAINGALQQLGEAGARGKDLSQLLGSDAFVHGMPLADTQARIKVGVGRLCGTTLYIASRLSEANNGTA